MELFSCSKRERNNASPFGLKCIRDCCNRFQLWLKLNESYLEIGVCVGGWVWVVIYCGKYRGYYLFMKLKITECFTNSWNEITVFVISGYHGWSCWTDFWWRLRWRRWGRWNDRCYRHLVHRSCMSSSDSCSLGEYTLTEETRLWCSPQTVILSNAVNNP